jgi:hypothetical protein
MSVEESTAALKKMLRIGSPHRRQPPPQQHQQPHQQQVTTPPSKSHSTIRLTRNRNSTNHRKSSHHSSNRNHSSNTINKNHHFYYNSNSSDSSPYRNKGKPISWRSRSAPSSPNLRARSPSSATTNSTSNDNNAATTILNIGTLFPNARRHHSPNQRNHHQRQGTRNRRPLTITYSSSATLSSKQRRSNSPPSRNANTKKNSASDTIHGDIVTGSSFATTTTATKISKKKIVVGPTCSLHVVLVDSTGNTHAMSKEITEEQLHRVFERYGKVYDITTGRQFHFVNFCSVQDAERAYHALDNTDGCVLFSNDNLNDDLNDDLNDNIVQKNDTSKLHVAEKNPNVVVNDVAGGGSSSAASVSVAAADDTTTIDDGAAAAVGTPPPPTTTIDSTPPTPTPTPTPTPPTTTATATTANTPTASHIQLQWAIPRNHHPLYQEMKDIQKERAKNQTFVKDHPNNKNTSVNTKNTNVSSLSTAPPTGGDHRPGVAETSLGHSVLFRHRSASLPTGFLNREYVNRKRWADVADEMSDEDDDDDGTIVVQKKKNTNKQKTNVSKLMFLSLTKPDVSFDQFLSPWSVTVSTIDTHQIEDTYERYNQSRRITDHMNKNTL